MPITYRIDLERDLVVSTAFGHTTGTELLEHVKDVKADPGFTPGMSELLDLRNIGEIDAHKEELERLAFSEREGVKTPSRTAVVATGDLAYGLSRMYQSNLGQEAQVKVHVFREIESAIKWLGIPSIELGRNV